MEAVSLFMDDLKSPDGPETVLGVRSSEEELPLLSPSSSVRSSEVETASPYQGSDSIPLPPRRRGRPTKAEAEARKALEQRSKVDPKPVEPADPNIHPTVDERLVRVLNDRGNPPPKNSKTCTFIPNAQLGS